jgi:Family of unknown function (DUF5898)
MSESSSSSSSRTKRPREDGTRDGETIRKKTSTTTTTNHSPQFDLSTMSREELETLLVNESKKREKEKHNLLKELKEKDALLQEKDALLNASKKRQEKSIFISLLQVKEGDFQLNVARASYSNANSDIHQEATALETEFKLHEPNMEKVKAIPRISRLLLEFVDQKNVITPHLTFKKFDCGSGSDICTLVRHACTDAIALLDIEGASKSPNLWVTMERSLFSCRPNIMVVRSKSNGKGLLSLEVKPPVSKDKTLVQFPPVLDHAFNHAMTMDAFGEGTPLVLITSFEESYLCSVNASDLEQAGLEQEHNESDGKEQSNGGDTQGNFAVRESVDSPKLALDEGSTSSSATATFPPTRSPTRKSSQKLGTINESSSDTERAASFTLGKFDRVLHRSQLFRSHQLVKLIFSALQIAQKNCKTSVVTIYELLPGKTYCFPKVLRAATGSAEYVWGELNNVRIGQPIVCPQETMDETSFYIIGALGCGGTSNVYQALDSSGTVVALKVYVNCLQYGYSMEQEDFDKRAKDATNREAELLREFYPFLKEKVKVVKIFDFYCVVMPVFQTIAKDERRAQLPKIKKVLTDIFKKKQKKYTDEDIHWRHVGNYNGNCVLYDLCDLEDVEDDDADDEYVDDECLGNETSTSNGLKITVAPKDVKESRL